MPPEYEPLEVVVGRMAEGAAGIVEEMRDSNRRIKLVLTAQQFRRGMLLFVIVIVSAVGTVAWRLNEAGDDRATVTQNVIVATIQCLYGGVQPDHLNSCVTDVLSGKPAPPPRVPPTTTTRGVNA